MHNAIVIWIGVRILIFLGYYICVWIRSPSDRILNPVFINQKKVAIKARSELNVLTEVDNVVF